MTFGILLFIVQNKFVASENFNKNYNISSLYPGLFVCLHLRVHKAVFIGCLWIYIEFAKLFKHADSDELTSVFT